MVKHYPYFDIDAVCDHYSQKDGVPVKYVLTTDLKASDTPVDIFYRSTPHPKFGNRYFGLYFDQYRNCSMICNADLVEEFTIAMVKNDDGDYEYSQSLHDYKRFKNGNMIDGGRLYARTSRGVDISYSIKDGELVPAGLRDVMKETEDYYYPGSDPQV